MRNDLVSVTDHIKNFSIERAILGNFFSDKLTSDTTIILVWHQLINKDFLYYISEKIKFDGKIFIATDCEDYAVSILDMIEISEGIEN